MQVSVIKPYFWLYIDGEKNFYFTQWTIIILSDTTDLCSKKKKITKENFYEITKKSMCLKNTLKCSKF